MTDLFSDNGAEFSPCRTWRTKLWRIWDRSKPPLAMGMLNPSDADEIDNDRTVGLQVKRAVRNGFGSLWVFNAHAYAETYPDQMKQRLAEGFDIVGPGNLAAVREIMIMVREAGGMVCVGWGVDGDIAGQDRVISALAAELSIQLHCVGTTKSGQPRHPLYVALAEAFQPWSAP